MRDLKDPAALLRALIRCRSITPHDAGAMDTLSEMLTPLGFKVERVPFGGEGRPTIENLYARRGTKRPNLAFAGHTDVVPEGDARAWTSGPFEAELRDGVIYGRGAVDMKGGIACFIAAAARFLQTHPEPKGSISLLITGDEEGAATDGTRRVLGWLDARAETIDHCVVGEPTNPDHVGDMIKIGRRGSLTGTLTVSGMQGHVAYPAQADNPIPPLVEILHVLTTHRLDDGTEHFDPSSLQVTTIDVGNPAINVIPAKATATFNIRFNPLHSAESLEAWLRKTCEAAAPGKYRLDVQRGGDAFLTEPGAFTELLRTAIASVTGRTPVFSTTGGTSDARFIKNTCPVAEFGLVGRTMHKVDECVSVEDLETLTRIYEALLERYFAGETG